MSRLDEEQEFLLQQARDIVSNYQSLKDRIGDLKRKTVATGKKAYLHFDLGNRANRILEMLNELLSDDAFEEVVNLSMLSADADAYMEKLRGIASSLRQIEEADDFDEIDIYSL